MYAVDMSAPATVVRRRQVGKLSGYAVEGYVETIAGNRAIARTVIRSCAGSAAEKIHAIARQTCDIVGAADYAQRNIGDVVIGPPAVGKSGRIAGEPAETLLVFRWCRRRFQIQP